MRVFNNLVLLCFFLLLGTAFTKASACKSSSGHCKIKLYIAQSTKYGNYSSVDDASAFGLTTENEDEETEREEQEYSVREGLSSLRSLCINDSVALDTSSFCYHNPPFVYTSAIYISQRVMRI